MSVSNPMAVLEMPMVLLHSAWTPVAVLKSPDVVLNSAWEPNAVLPTPCAVTFCSAPPPPAVLPLPSLVVGFGGPPQLGVNISIIARAPARVVKLADRVMVASVHRSIPARMSEHDRVESSVFLVHGSCLTLQPLRAHWTERLACVT